MAPKLLALALAAGAAMGASAWAQTPPVVAAQPPVQAPPLAGEVALSPRQFAQLAAVRSPEVRYSRLGVDVAGHLSDAEASLYEAVLFANLRGTDLNRQRTVEERLSSAAFLSILDERSSSVEAGVRQRLPTAGELSLSYRIVRRATNIIETANAGVRDTEWTGALVIGFKQPLLRNGGRSVLETDRRVAELEHQVQWTQFRQQVLKSTADALNLYWQLGRAQDARLLREESLRNVRRIAQEVEARIQAGRAPPVNQIEVSSTVLARQSEVTRAEQAVREAEARVMTTLGLSAAEHPGVRLKASLDQVPPLAETDSLEQALQRALAQWPPFQVSRLRLQQGQLRLNFARNQRQPQLDLTANYSASGLSYHRAEARHLATSDKYPEWVVGLNFEMPLGGARADGQYDAQVVRVRQNELELEAIRTSLANDLAQRRDELEATLRLAAQMQDDLRLRQRLVDAERDRYNLGVGQLSQWLLRENELLEARQRLAEVVMRAHMARVAWQFAQGSLLDEYDIALRNE
jgi:outer membrane protein TolC